MQNKQIITSTYNLQKAMHNPQAVEHNTSTCMSTEGFLVAPVLSACNFFIIMNTSSKIFPAVSFCFHSLSVLADYQNADYQSWLLS